MSLSGFRKEIKGWKTTPKGEDFCPVCWQKFLTEFPGSPKEKKKIKENSQPTSTKSIAEKRCTLEVWFVRCFNCEVIISVPLSPDEQSPLSMALYL